MRLAILRYADISAGFTLPESATADTTVGGFLLAAGTPCIIDWMRINTEAPFWNPEHQAAHPAKHACDGKMFWPERFETLSATQYRWSFLRFGLGQRKCMGKNMSPVIMKLFVSAVLRDYRLEVNDGFAEGASDHVEVARDRFTVTPRQAVRFVRL